MSFPTYVEYQQSRHAWLGNVPEHWIVAKTAWYFDIAMGQTILREELIDDGEWPVFSATDGDHYFGRVNDPRVQLNVGDIVIPARGNSIGAVKIVKEPATTTQTTTMSLVQRAHGAARAAGTGRGAAGARRSASRYAPW